MPQNDETNEKFGMYKSVCCGAAMEVDRDLISQARLFINGANVHYVTELWIKPEQAPTDWRRHEVASLVVR